MDANSGETSSDAGRSYAGPEILRIGFRPFFLVAGIWSALAVVLWLGGLAGVVTLPTA
ncbi:MAG: NnrS family protein, partial [Alphaproteobacteria bacterium]